MPSKPRSEEPKPACDALRSSQDVCVFNTVKKTKLQHPEPDESDSEFGGFKVGRLSARRSRRPLASPTPIRRRPLSMAVGFVGRLLLFSENKTSSVCKGERELEPRATGPEDG